MSTRVRPFMREAANPRKPPIRSLQRRLADTEWMRRGLQKEINDDTLHHELSGIPDLRVLLKHLRNGPLLNRNRAMVVLANHRKIPSQTICDFLGVGKLSPANAGTNSISLAAMPYSLANPNQIVRSTTKSFGALFLAYFTNHPRTMTSTAPPPLLCQVLKRNGTQIGPALVS
jgi:hypothetical protein